MTSPTEISARYDHTNGLFNAIASRYDRTNCLISFGLNKWWHRRLVAGVRQVAHATILDLACGTGTLTKKLAGLPGTRVTGIDPSVNMLAVAGQRMTHRRRSPGGGEQVAFLEGYAEALPFPDNSFHVVTVSYGIRNFADRDAAFRQALRVLKPGGMIFVLEFSLKAETSAMMALQRFYIHRLLPLAGWLFTGEKAAYRYLRDSVAGFPAPQAICDEMKTAGFKEIKFTRFVPGVAVLFTGLKES